MRNIIVQSNIDGSCERYHMFLYILFLVTAVILLLSIVVLSMVIAIKVPKEKQRSRNCNKPINTIEQLETIPS